MKKPFNFMQVFSPRQNPSKPGFILGLSKTLKIAAIAVAVVLLAALVAPIALRGKIARIVKSEANAMLRARLDFEKLDISLLRHFPHASVDLKGLTLIGTERFEGDTIVAAKRISVVVDLLSLFGDEGFEVTKIILSAPALHAHKLADGAVNWDIMQPSEEPAPEEETPSDEPSAFRLRICDLRIADAAIRYQDDSSRMSFSTAPLSLRLRGDMAADRTDLDLRLAAREMRLVSGGIPLLSGAEAELVATIAADLTANRFTLTRNTLRLNAISLSLDGWVELGDEAIAMDLKAGCDKVQFKDVLSLIPAFYTKDFRNLSAAGELGLSLWAQGEMRGSKLPAFELKADVHNGSFRYSSLPKAVTDIEIAAKIANPGGPMDKTEVDLSRFGLKMAGNSLAATAYATALTSDPRFRATVAGKVDLGAIKEVYPLDKGVELGGVITADVKLSGCMSNIEKQRYEKLGAAGTFVIEQLGATLPDLPPVYIKRAAATITPKAMTLGELGIMVGRSDLAANGQLTDYLGYLLRGDKLSGRLYVKSELLDLNEIMAALPASDETPAAAEPEKEPMQAIEIPENLNLSLNTDLREIRCGKMTVSALTGEMSMSGGTLSLDKLAMRLFEGQANVVGSYSTAKNPRRPALRLSLGLKGASFEQTFEQLEMVQQLVPIFAKTGGNYSLGMDMTATLDETMSPDLQSIDATGEIKSADIRIHEIAAFDALAKALGNDKLSRIEAKDVAIRFAIRNGRIATQPFDLKLAGTNINLSGTTGLDQTIDYTAKVATSSATNGVLETLDVKIGGTFTAPKITLGVKQAVEQAAKNIVDEQIEKLTGSESLSAEIEKQAEKLRAEAVKAGEKLVAAAQSQRDKLVAEAAKKGALAKLAAQAAGDKLVTEAEKQAAELTAEAEKQIEKLTAKK